ncbi:hypothetical protein GPECTOR_6g877 [Gonium pectorale]|uniref:Bromo domain-containing protein n=1 Tax=Gonium pectorale TaxID=33097 RepID=A0A150GW88_GONPE|nr:hypothetical protein GPECTOR_6g877 [Gonium pectorale]|eukprot:KXZ53958.1 hypothetical protein GPECTOR_6g877 [Gonium pectorale]
MDQRQGPRAMFNSILGRIVQHLLDNTPHADFFRNPVSRVVVTDYGDYVPADQEMYLGRLLERANKVHYSCFAEFLEDLKLIRANATAYNGSGGGKHAYEPVVHWAADLEASAIEQVTLHAEALLIAEAAITQVFVKPSKVVYLPTAFVEEEFDVSTLPLDCELAVEADGVDTEERFKVTIKAVPRSGLSTMYCITNVMAFQQRYLNWQIYNWTCLDATHMKIHLQQDSLRFSDDGMAGAWSGLGAGGSGKRRSDMGRYGAGPSRGVLLGLHDSEVAGDPRMSVNGSVRRCSPVPESPPALEMFNSHAALLGQLMSHR